MNRFSLYLCVTGALLAASTVAAEPSAYERARVKTLSGISDRYNHTVIRSKKDLRNQDEDIGLNNTKARGYSTVHNIVEIRNIKADSRHLENIGVKINCRNRGSVTNHVNVRGAMINRKNSGSVNSGIELTGCKNNTTRENINNNVNITRSRVGR